MSERVTGRTRPEYDEELAQRTIERLWPDTCTCGWSKTFGPTCPDCGRATPAPRAALTTEGDSGE